MTEYVTSNRVEPVAVEPRPNHCIWVRFADGIEGKIDLSRWVGIGAFKAWGNTVPFEAVHITAWGAIGWNEDLDLCPDALYMELAGKTEAELFPALRRFADKNACMRRAADYVDL